MKECRGQTFPCYNVHGLPLLVAENDQFRLNLSMDIPQSLAPTLHANRHYTLPAPFAIYVLAPLARTAQHKAVSPLIVGCVFFMHHGRSTRQWRARTFVP